MCRSSPSRAMIAAEIGRARSARRLRDWTEIRAEGSRSRSRFRLRAHRFRCSLVAERGTKATCGGRAPPARARLESLSSGAGSCQSDGQSGPGERRTRSVGCLRGRGRRPGRLAMLFPGQGSQYVGMLRELACQFPRMQAALARANEARDWTGTRLSDRIYPRPAYDDSERQATRS